jgi:hypothetical protein
MAYWKNNKRFAAAPTVDLEAEARQRQFASEAEWAAMDPAGHHAVASQAGGGDTQVADRDEMDALKLGLILASMAAPVGFGGGAGAAAAGGANAARHAALMAPLTAAAPAAAAGGLSFAGALPTIIGAAGSGLSAYGASRNARDQREADARENSLDREQRERESVRATELTEAGRDPYRDQVQQAKAAAKLDLLMRMQSATPRTFTPAGRYASSVPTMAGGTPGPNGSLRTSFDSLRNSVLSGERTASVTGKPAAPARNVAAAGPTAQIQPVGARTTIDPNLPARKGAITPPLEDVDEDGRPLSALARIRRRIAAAA